MKITRYFSSRTIGRVCTALLTLCTISANAQETEPGGSPMMITFTAAEALRADNAAQILAERLHLNAGADELRSAYIEQPGDGLQVQRFNQYFKGIRVTNGTYTLSSKNGIASYAFGKFYPSAGITGTTPQIDEATALTSALAHIRADKYAWQDGSGEYPKGSLAFVEDFSTGDGDGALHLAYAFDVYAVAPLSRDMIYVDASTGKILFMDAILKHVNAKAASLYSDTLTFQAGLISGLFYLADSTRGSGVYTYSLNRATTIPSPIPASMQITSTTSLFAQDASIDAHWGAEQVYDYWKNSHNRLSWNGTNGVLRSFVHYDNNYFNAFWDGSAMNYGDGTGNSTPLTTLDICGHEIGHGVCQSTANLVYSKESGAMNEGFSDIWGAVIENYANPHEVDRVAKDPWLIAEELGTPFRSMREPKLYGQPDTYQGSYWVYAGTGCANSNDNCGVHTNSGILNYWFYLLSVGGQGTNDLANAYQVRGVTITKAAKIAYATELALTSTSTYANCRIASIAAATTLYGSCSPEVEAVTRAWYAVGVGTNFTPCTPQVSFMAPTVSTDENAGINSCQANHVVSLPVALNGPAPVGGNAVVTVTPIGGTAVAGVDYTIASGTLTFPAGSTAPQSVAITVLDNGALGTDKYIDLAMSVSAAGSNVTKASVLDTVRVTISNDDVAPDLGGTVVRSVLSYTVAGNSTSPFQSSARAGRAQYIYTAEELKTAGVRAGAPITAATFIVTTKNSGTNVFTNYTLKLAPTTQINFSNAFLTAGFVTVYSANTTTTSGLNAFPFTTPYIWDGVSNIAIEVCFTNSATATTTANDQVQANSGGSSGAYATSASAAVSGCSLPFAANTIATARPVIRFTQDIPPTPVDTALHGTRSWTINASQQVYFYNNDPAKQAIAAILFPSDTLGCVTTTITASGIGFVPARGGSHRSVKEFMVTPTRQGAGVTFDGIFYLSNIELAGIDPNLIRIVQTNSVDDNSMTPNNTNIVTPTDIINGLDYTGFRGSFTGFNRFFLTDGDLALAVNGTLAKAAELWTGANPFQTTPVLHWSLPAQERVSIRLYDITGKLMYGTEQTLAAGTHQMSVSGNADFAPGTYVLQVIRPSGVFTRQLVKQ